MVFLNSKTVILWTNQEARNFFHTLDIGQVSKRKSFARERSKEKEIFFPKLSKAGHGRGIEKGSP